MERKEKKQMKYKGGIKTDIMKRRREGAEGKTNSRRPKIYPKSVNVKFGKEFGTGTGCSRSSSAFPLSVSFHQCSILIHSPFTDANNPSNWQTAPFTYPTSTSILPYSLSVVVLAVNSQDRHTAGNLLPKVLTVDICDI
jgi:hypothetical protein